MPIGKEVVKIDELGTAERAFELLAGGVLGAAAILVLLSALNVLLVGAAGGHSQLVVGD